MSVKISIITVCLNANSTIEKTINAVLNQGYNKEYIMIDGGSFDGALDAIDKYKDKISYFVSYLDYRLCHTVNKGIEKDIGDIASTINTDDCMFRAYHIYNIQQIHLAKETTFFKVSGLASNNILRSFNEEMIIKVENVENVYKAFFVHYLKLLIYGIMSVGK